MCRGLDHSVSLHLPYRDLSIDLSLLTGNTQSLNRKCFSYPAADAVPYLIDLDLPARGRRLIADWQPKMYTQCYIISL